MRKNLPENQLSINFNNLEDRLILIPDIHGNMVESQAIFEQIMQDKLTIDDQDIFPSLSITKHLNARLPYPESVKIAHLRNATNDFIGFSAIKKGMGWIYINANAKPVRRNYYSYLLTASLGMKSLYSDQEKLSKRTEELVFRTLLPKKEVSSFFHERISNISPILATNISDYFNVPFEIVLKRAFQLSIISENQLHLFLPVARELKDIKPKAELYISNED